MPPSCVLTHSPLRVTACPGTAPPALPAQPSYPQSHASHLVAGAGEEDRSRRTGRKTGAGQEQEDRSRSRRGGQGARQEEGHNISRKNTCWNAYAKGPQRTVAQHGSCTTQRDAHSAPNQQTHIRLSSPPCPCLPCRHCCQATTPPCTLTHTHAPTLKHFSRQHPPDSMGEIALGRPSSGPARLTYPARYLSTQPGSCCSTQCRKVTVTVAPYECDTRMGCTPLDSWCCNSTCAAHTAHRALLLLSEFTLPINPH